MGYPQHAAEAYAAIDPSLTSPGRAEAMVFGKVTRKLEAVFADDDASIASRNAALHDNRRLWQAAAYACASDDNALPDALRASLISLAGFVDRHTSQVFGGTADPSPLFEINRRVAAGLSAAGR
ncbi:flagellar biosynthesis regulatory protein FlaF [Jannaschia seosinensis]|uniref:Flagellar biosynthesis regulatory protein FlaF n=1 Tax=Jannaschia seosinensis TaxID=313367 RepID=A0A0M7BFT0_9RHOB|nr:flagellar biosynthesis regulator FlaF [Jannaschia seosinensis]CUH40642.1 flagellar biosynthesis regulatory protein FlaF [Jannaschia seosinensis]